MTSHPPRSCCFKGVKHEGTATGSYDTINDFEVYIKYPENKSTEKGILIITDAMGHRSINIQLLADQLAENGYFVLMPDVFHGDPVPIPRREGFDIMAWLGGEYHPEKKAHNTTNVDPVIDACLKEMRSKYNCKKIGAIGYCFGGKYVCRFLHPKAGQIDAGYTAHPSFVNKEELEGIEGPLAIAAAETDEIFPEDKRHESEAILKKLGVPYQINLYSGVVHGFAVRADLSKPVQKYAKESAFLQALGWFEEHLG